MLATSDPRKPAWPLACAGMRLRLGVRPNAFGNALGDSFVDMMRPTDNRGMLNAVNRANDPEYYGTDNRSVLNAVNRTSDPEYYGSQGGSGAGSYQFGELGSGSFGIGMPVSDQVLAMADEARGGRILEQMRDADTAAPRTYTVRDGDNPASIGRAFFGDERAGATILANSGLSASARGARGLQIGQVLTIPDSISDGNLRAGGQLIGMDAAIRAQETAALAQQATNAYSGISGDEISARYFANGNGRFSTYQADQALAAQNIAVALGGGFGIPDADMSPYVASGMGNPVTAAVAGAMADATMSTVRIGTAMNENPSEAAIGFIKKGINYGPEAFNAAVQITKLTAQGYVEMAGSVGLMSPGSVENFRNMSPYQVTPLFAYNGDAQFGGSLLGDAVLGIGAAKYGDYNVKWNTSPAGTANQVVIPMPFRLEASASRLTVMNRQGDFYPNVPDLRTGRSIAFPEGDFARVGKAERVSWDSTDRYAFIKDWHDRGYQAPRGGWSEYDIHHIKPREFGGDNSFWNLTPVQRQTHSEWFNKFWRGY